MINIKCDRCGKRIILKDSNISIRCYPFDLDTSKKVSNKPHESIYVMAKDDDGVFRSIDLCNDCKFVIYSSIFDCYKGDIKDAESDDI